MTTTAYYNEIDPYAAQWLRNLIDAGEIAPGDVDERSIEDVKPTELMGYTQCHFFAGLGGWSYALRLAGFPDDRPVWTGSCPCQPFSAAGKRGGTVDERHLWPAWFHLIEVCRPVNIFGEQVASKDGLAWLDDVSSDLEGAGYAAGAVDLAAFGVGAPHLRNRLWLVADRLQGWDGGSSAQSRTQQRPERLRPTGHGGSQAVADTDEIRRQGQQLGAGSTNEAQAERVTGDDGHKRCSAPGSGTVGDTDRENWRANGGGSDAHDEGLQGARPAWQNTKRQIADRFNGSPGPTNGWWADAEYVYCKDGKDGCVRTVEPGSFPLGYGIPNRVGRIRAYGNAIVPQAAAEVIGAYLESQDHIGDSEMNGAINAI